MKISRFKFSTLNKIKISIMDWWNHIILWSLLVTEFPRSFKNWWKKQVKIVILMLRYNVTSSRFIMTLNSNMVGYIISSIVELHMCKSKTVWAVKLPINRYPWIWWIFQRFVNFSHRKNVQKTKFEIFSALWWMLTLREMLLGASPGILSSRNGIFQYIFVHPLLMHENEEIIQWMVKKFPWIWKNIVFFPSISTEIVRKMFFWDKFICIIPQPRRK